MLLYTNEDSIASSMYAELGSDNVSMYEVEDYVRWNYPDEDEVTSNDINNIRYAYLRYADESRCDYHSGNEDYDEDSTDTDSYSSIDSYSYDSSDTSYSSYSSYSYESSDTSYSSYDYSSKKRRYLPHSKIRNLFFSALGIFIIFQIIVMVFDSITWESLIEDFMDSDELFINIVGLVIFCPIGLGIGKFLQFLYEDMRTR